MTAEDAWTGNEIRESCETGLDDMIYFRGEEKSWQEIWCGFKGI